jgi:hypothetical protein
MKTRIVLNKAYFTGAILVIQMLYFPVTLISQDYKVISATTKEGIGFVNIGVVGKNTGTVTGATGNFSLNFTELDESDSLRFSMIGYEPVTYYVGRLKKEASKTVELIPKIYELPETKIIYPRGKEVMLGTPVISTALKSGFADNNLGYELGIKVYVKKRLKLKDINLNVGSCTYDSVTYRLNIYKLTEEDKWENILSNPIYISFTMKDIHKEFTFSLKEYSILLEGEYIITLELYRDLGTGKLLFLTQFFTGTTWNRKSRESEWRQTPGQVGLFLHGQLIK